MPNRLFEYSTCHGYSIIEVKVEGEITSDLKTEAKRVARCLYKNEEYSTDISVLKARLFVTDGEPFLFNISVSPDHRCIDIEVKLCNKVIETETLRV